jgi:hypothetical protein
VLLLLLLIRVDALLNYVQFFKKMKHSFGGISEPLGLVLHEKGLKKKSAVCVQFSC